MHPYAWTIIAAAAVKIFKLLPHDVEDSTADWGDMIGAVLVPPGLVGVSITYIDMTQVFTSLSNPLFILLDYLHRRHCHPVLGRPGAGW